MSSRFFWDLVARSFRRIRGAGHTICQVCQCVDEFGNEDCDGEVFFTKIMQ